jgi:hypothetical protein
MRKIEEIKRILKEYKKELSEKYKIKEIGIFGSYIRGESKKDSDLDVLVEFKPDAKMDLIKFIELENYISDALGIKVDLVMKSALKPRIGKCILKEVGGGIFMKREIGDYLQDIVDAMDKAIYFIKDISYDEFIQQE